MRGLEEAPEAITGPDALAPIAFMSATAPYPQAGFIVGFQLQQAANNPCPSTTGGSVA